MLFIFVIMGIGLYLCLCSAFEWIGDVSTGHGKIETNGRE